MSDAVLGEIGDPIIYQSSLGRYRHGFLIGNITAVTSDLCVYTDGHGWESENSFRHPNHIVQYAKMGLEPGQWVHKRDFGKQVSTPAEAVVNIPVELPTEQIIEKPLETVSQKIAEPEPMSIQDRLEQRVLKYSGPVAAYVVRN